jgi:pimeloyl-ACP methyl ester carboxylesterase
MTQFLDVRLSPVGGELARSVAVHQGTSIDDYMGISMSGLLNSIRGQHVLIATHGFNVNRKSGIACLSNWESLLQLPPSSAFVGLLWPGDSVWAHGLDYPDEPRIADETGALIAAFLDANFGAAASISFASHSLGARVVLAAVAQINLPVRRLMLMAPAIDDNCLATEFQNAVAKVEAISVLASKKDEVLAAAFPLGNFFAGIIAAGHPWWRAALGHTGPVSPLPANFKAPYEIPDNWNYQHGNYLDVPQGTAPNLPIPTDIPPNGSPVPAPDVGADGNPMTGWQEAFSSAFASTRFR